MLSQLKLLMSHKRLILNYAMSRKILIIIIFWGNHDHVYLPLSIFTDGCWLLTVLACAWGRQRDTEVVFLSDKRMPSV